MNIDYFYNIEQISQKYNDDNLFNAYIHCKYQLNALRTIRKRYDSDSVKLLELSDKQSGIMSRTKGSPREFLTPEDRLIIKEYHEMLDQLRLDHESFIIYARILMDKIALTSRLIIRDYNLPYSFNDQKQWFRKPSNIPYKRNEGYAVLVRDKTDWFDMSLKFVRDKFIIHSLPRLSSYLVSRSRGIRVNFVQLGGSKEDADELINMKHKYQEKYPSLHNIQDNLFEILHCFQNNDFALDADDKEHVIEIIKRNGTDLTEVDYIQSKLFEFLESFKNIFVT